MTLLKGFVEGNLEQIKQQDINADKFYAIKDLPDNSITNAQMESALTDNSIAAFFRINNTYICIDNGTYKEGDIYRWLGNSWQKVNVDVGDKTDELTINRNGNDELQSIGVVYDTGVLSGNMINTAMTIKRYENG